MRRSVSRALLTVALAAVAASCASGGNAGVALGGDTGGRYLVLIPDFEGVNGDRVANDLRALVSGSQTHVAVNAKDIERSMAQYSLTALDETLTRQLGQAIQAQLVAWGEVRQGAGGLQADVKFIDTRSGDQIELSGTGAAPRDLAASLYTSLERSFDGIRQATFCNDNLSIEEFERALENCEAALAIVPNSSAALYGKATALLNLDRVDEALATYTQLLEVDPLHQDALLGAGFAASRLDRGQQAMGYYNRYLEINPGNVQVRMTVTNDIAQTGDYISAFRVLETAIADNRDNVDFQKYLFAIATAAGQRSQEGADSVTARQIFSIALAAYEAGYANGEAPEPAQLRQAIAVNTALGRTSDAIRLARDATQRFPSDPQMWQQLGNVLSQAGQHAEAIQALTRLIELDPEHQDAYIRRAQAYIQAGQRQQAIPDLERAAQRGDRERVATLLFSIGAESVRAENWADAVSILSTAREYASGSVRSDITFFLGFSTYKQGEAIARANTQGNAQQAQRALEFFNRALPLLESSQHAQAGQVAGGAREYIANQQAIIRAAR